LKTSFEYFSKAIKYLNEIDLKQNDNQYNKLMKLFAIAYLKTYIYYYVEINYYHFDDINFNNINSLFKEGIIKDNLGKNTKIIYIWKKYCKKFENFHIFENFDFSRKKIPLQKEIFHKINEEKKLYSSNYIFKESFIPINGYNLYTEICSDFTTDPNKSNFNFEEINKNFDAFYCFLVNKIISYLYSSEKKFFETKMISLHLTTQTKLRFLPNGSLIYRNLLTNLNDSIFKKIADRNIINGYFYCL
jgi:hypothetical protein